MMSRVMNKDQAWKNFNLGEELHVSGAFIYTGLRRFHEMRTLNNTDELFEFFYNISVGIERLLKIAVVLLEHDPNSDQKKFERSLKTHNHPDLLKRVRKHAEMSLAGPHNEFLALLGSFYKTLRYERFTLISAYRLDREREALIEFLGNRFQPNIGKESSLFPIPNDARYRKYIRDIVTRISSEVFGVVARRASDLNLYTYELRDGSKAQTVFLGEADFQSEDVLWKELLIFFMNTKSNSGVIEFLRSIEPLELDPELATEYLECFQSDVAKASAVGEVDTLYEDLENREERLKQIHLIGNPKVCFDSDDPDDEVSYDD
jgi:hypothetical protein